MTKTEVTKTAVKTIAAVTPGGVLIDLGIQILPEVIAALKASGASNLAAILESSDSNADILINTAQKEEADIETM